MSFPTHSGKTSLEDLKSTPKLSWSNEEGVSLKQPTVYHFEESGFKFDFLWSPLSSDTARESARHRRW